MITRRRVGVATGVWAMAYLLLALTGARPSPIGLAGLVAVGAVGGRVALDLWRDTRPVRWRGPGSPRVGRRRVPVDARVRALQQAAGPEAQRTANDLVDRLAAAGWAPGRRSLRRHVLTERDLTAILTEMEGR